MTTYEKHLHAAGDHIGAAMGYLIPESDRELVLRYALGILVSADNGRWDEHLNNARAWDIAQWTNRQEVLI